MKTRNFFLGVFGFLILAITVFVINEYASGLKHAPARIQGLQQTIEPIQMTTTPYGQPGWLIPLEQIESGCDHPWIIHRRIPKLNHTIDSLQNAGLSKCYEFVDENALKSHLWYQGVKQLQDGDLLPEDRLITAENIVLFFDYYADFRTLGVQKPKTVTLSGRVIHDLNGDGVFNTGEPVISGARICILREGLDPLCVDSNSNGIYAFKDILPGGWRFIISSPKTGRFTEFKYTNKLIQRDQFFPESTKGEITIPGRYLNLTEFNIIDNEILVLVEHDLEYDFFLMQEWATYFSSQRDSPLFSIQAYYDLDVHEGKTRIYNGETGPTYDQHDGLDVSCPIGTEILSVAEGRVLALYFDSTVAILHSNQLVSIYGHGTPLVEVNQFVPRGYPISLCNERYTMAGPHLHFAVWRNSAWLPRVAYGIPPFAEMQNMEEKWISNRRPLDENQYVFVLQGGRGIWTEINNPHFPYIKYQEK